MELFQQSDLFALGVGFDIAGGYLVARGLLASPRDIFRRSINHERFFVPRETASQIADRVDAMAGLTSLLTGFSIQAIAYALTAASVHGVVNGPRWADGLVAALTALIGASATLGAWRLRRWPMIRNTIIAVAHDPLQLNAQYNLVDADRTDGASAMRLRLLALEFGHGPREGEDDPVYAQRVFGITDLVGEDFLVNAFHPARLG